VDGRLQLSLAVVVDVVLVIRRDSVEVYCNPVNYVSLLPLVAHWRRVHIHCLPEALVGNSLQHSTLPLCISTH